MTQKQAILEYLNRFGEISPMDAFADLGITKLATRISEMKKDGLCFKTETIKSKNRIGKTVHYCKYKLEEQENNNGIK